MNASFIESSDTSEQSSCAPRLNRSCAPRSSIRKNLTKKMFINNVSQQICDIQHKEFRLKQREMILNTKETELLERERMVLLRERALKQRGPGNKTAMNSAQNTLSARSRSITFDQLDSIDSVLESTESSQQQTKQLKSKKKPKLLSFFRFRRSKGPTHHKVNKLVQKILVSDEQETLMNALEILSRMSLKDSKNRSVRKG